MSRAGRVPVTLSSLTAPHAHEPGRIAAPEATLTGENPSEDYGSGTCFPAKFDPFRKRDLLMLPLCPGERATVTLYSPPPSIDQLDVDDEHETTTVTTRFPCAGEAHDG